MQDFWYQNLVSVSGRYVMGISIDRTLKTDTDNLFNNTVTFLDVQ